MAELKEIQLYGINNTDTHEKRFIDSKFNLLNIQPTNSIINTYTYYLGVFMKNYDIGLNGTELTEVEQAPSGSRIEDYFPLVIEALNKRGNWIFLNTQQANDTNMLNFAFTNSSSILTKAFSNYRFLLNSNIHYISNKSAFYDKFCGHDFIIDYMSLNKGNVMQMRHILDAKFTNQKVILKPDKGSVSSGIVILDSYNFEDVKKNVERGQFNDWTLSSVFLPKLYDGYIISNRIYFLVTKVNNKIVKSYFYKDFMNYRAMKRFTGNIESKEEFLTNYMDHDDPNSDETFVKTRFIPHADWIATFPEVTQNLIYNKLGDIFRTITDTMKDDLICYNDNILQNKKIHIKKHRVGFHIYGVDALINEAGDIKIIEINGAPAFNVKTRYYGVPNRIDYFYLMEEIIQKTLDPIYPPLICQPVLNNFIEVYSGFKINNPVSCLYYIPKSIITSYGFIYDALNKRKYLKRTKNMFDNIDVFYGLRERYIVPQSSMNYYDEIINYKMSQRMKNAKIINKIQGITYYLASKDGLYKKMIDKYGEDVVHTIHPESILIYYNLQQEELFQTIKDKLSKIKGVRKWIVKPVHGSRGIGIKIFDTSSTLATDIANYIDNASQTGFSLTRKSGQYTFDGKEIIASDIKKYKYWIISRYLDTPHILTPFLANKLSLKSRPHFSNFIQNKPSIIGKKYNIRFYVLIVLDKLPTFADLETFKEDDSYNIVNVYLYTDYMVYFSMLSYHSRNIPEIYRDLDPKILSDMKNLTNLEMVNIVTQTLGSRDPPVIIDPVQEKKDVTCMLSDLYPVDSVEFMNIKTQITKIAQKTIESIKYDLRPLNRHENFKSCFNLLAYDTLLDNTGKLWLIEINRGPDMVGLQYNIGNQGCFEMFDDIFKLSIDPYYQTEINSPQCSTKTVHYNNHKELKKSKEIDEPKQSITTEMLNAAVIAGNQDLYAVDGVDKFQKLKIEYKIIDGI